MTEKTFLIKMDDEFCCDTGDSIYCYMRGFSVTPCKGDLNNRPKWCPLVPVKKVTKNYADLGNIEAWHVWVEE